jgi:trehalose/maltose transport system substrate-binding protein
MGVPADRAARRWASSIAVRGIVIAGALLSAVPAAAVEIAISCSALGRELELCRDGANAWAAQTGHTVRIVSTPNDATARFALYQQLLAARSADVDVLQIDVIWPAALAAHLYDLSSLVVRQMTAAHLPALIENSTIDGHLVAMPWFVDVGLLYYRRDLLQKYQIEPPRTWQELTEAARRVQDGERAAGNPRMWGFVFQGRPYEGLTCNALEWIAAAGGGRMLGDDGAPTINNEHAAAALTLAHSWIGSIAPEGVLNYGEEDARGVFQSGNAVFMRNWPYAWALANATGSPIAGQVGVMALPAGTPDGQHAGTLGGGELAVSRYSRHPDIAAQLVLYLAGAAEQRRRAIEGSFAPTMPMLYEDAELQRAQPLMVAIGEAVRGAVARPVREAGGRYNQISDAIWLAVHATLSGNGTAAENLAALDGRIARLRRPR